MKSKTAALIFLCLCSPVWAKNQQMSVQVNGVERHYLLHIPGGEGGDESLPVVMMFHGGGGSAQNAVWETGWARKADDEKFLAVFPDGTPPDPSRPASFRGNPQTWNDGSQRGVGATTLDVDDIGFVRRIIEDLSSRYNIDKSRIYATGFSNGASMTFRVGRELSSMFAAIAPVSGADWLLGQTITRPVSLLYVTGTSDPLNPFAGGKVRLVGKTYGTKPPVMDMINAWTSLLGCTKDKSTEILNKGGVKAVEYQGCMNGAEVELYTIEGHGHHWPGGKSLLPASIAGPRSNALKATDVIWDFFKKHVSLAS
jgi:polyhydroxybutyrate depolymerase